MKKNFLIIVCAAGILLFAAACTTHTVNKKLEGTWKSKDGITRLTITDKDFTTEEDGKPVTEDYFLKGDTIFTSYEGSRPFTKFQIKSLDDHKLMLMYPDSDIVEFGR